MNERSTAKCGDLRLMARSSTSGQGRKKGVPNRVTRTIKEMLLGALDDAGGREYLAKQAKANPAAFMSLLGRLVPQELKAEIDANTKLSMPNGAVIYIPENGRGGA